MSDGKLGACRVLIGELAQLAERDVVNDGLVSKIEDKLAELAIMLSEAVGSEYILDPRNP